MYNVEYAVVKENVGLAEEIEFYLCGIKLKIAAPDIDDYLRAYEACKLREFIKEKKVVEEVKFDLVVRLESDRATTFFLYWREHDKTDGAYKTWEVKLIDA